VVTVELPAVTGPRGDRDRRDGASGALTTA